jgi:hypothetical protein
MSSPIAPRRFQFSLRGLLVAITLVAIAFGATVVFGGPLFGLLAVTIYLLYATPLVIVVIYSKGAPCAFSIGALLPWIVIWPKGPPQSTDLLNLIVFLVWLLIFGGGCGLVAAATYRWVVRSVNRDGE